MLKRIISMLLCICTLMGMLIMPTYAADAVRAGEKATVITDWHVFEKPDISSKVTGYLSAGNVVDVLEAYIDGKGGIDGRWHKISYSNKMPISRVRVTLRRCFRQAKKPLRQNIPLSPKKYLHRFMSNLPLQA